MKIKLEPIKMRDVLFIIIISILLIAIAIKLVMG